MDDSGQSADHEAKDTAENDKGASGYLRNSPQSDKKWVGVGERHQNGEQGGDGGRDDGDHQRADFGQVGDPPRADPADGVCHSNHRDEQGGVGQRES